MPVEVLSADSAPTGLFVITFHVPGILDTHQGTEVWQNPFTELSIQNVVANLGRDAAPAATNVRVDVNKWDANAATPSWATIFTTQDNRPAIAVGTPWGSATVPDVTTLLQDDALSIDIDTPGGGATPTDYDLTVNIMVQVITV